MDNSLIYNKLVENLGYDPTKDQSLALEQLASFIYNNSNDSIFVLTGYAGTGKTSVISALVKTLDSLRIRSTLMAPTGRAAKVLSSYSDKKAYTIHKKIYRQKTYKDGEGYFCLDRNLSKNTWFIVDESSMISNFQSEETIFGSGKLLDDLIQYVYSGVDCKLILVGDNAQLPPVGSDTSPALNHSQLAVYGFNIESCSLHQVVRQSQESGILMNATKVRLQIAGKEISTPQIDLNGFPDIIRINGNDLVDELSDSYSKCGLEETVVVVNSNKLANNYNKGIRNSVLYRDPEEEISSGDIVMVVKNNYSLVDENDENGPGFIANGDIAHIQRIRRYEERYGFRFATMELYFPDYDITLESKVMLDVIYLDSPTLPKEKAKEFFFAVEADYAHLTTKKRRYNAVKADPYYNALQIKFAYAVTCHKAQGGQWKRVFIDQGMFSRWPVSIDYLRWFYTAITRATERLYLVNFPKEYFGEETDS